jgi:hypothetical protein
MSDKKDIKEDLAGLSGGFSTGLKLWLFFLFCFFFMGYSVPLSIFLGAAGGLASALVVGWWKTKDEPIEPQPVEINDLDENFPRVSGLRLAKQRRDAKTQNRTRYRTKRLLMPFSRFFEKRDQSQKNLSKKSRQKIAQSEED